MRGSKLLTLLSFLPTLAFAQQGYVPYTAPEEDLTATLFAPTTGSTVTITQNIGTVIIDAGGAIAALSVVLPSCSTSFDRQILHLASAGKITSVTMTAASGSVSNPVAAVGVNGGFAMYVCWGETSTWYRIG